MVKNIDCVTFTNYKFSIMNNKPDPELIFYTDWLSNQSWIFAKTYAKTTPHYYIIKDHLNQEDQKIYSQFVKFVFENGYIDPFYNNNYIAIDINGYKYWTMGIIENQEKPYEYIIEGRNKFTLLDYCNDSCVVLNRKEL
jgi:hypothetical protein